MASPLFSAPADGAVVFAAKKKPAQVLQRLAALPKLAGVTAASRLEVRPAPEMVSSGIREIDKLAGGLPRGCLSEICGPASSGRTSVLLAALAAATRRQWRWRSCWSSPLATETGGLTIATSNPDVRSRLAKLVGRLRTKYGAPSPPPAKTAFELVAWEKVAYLASDEKRANAFALLRRKIGLTPRFLLPPARRSVRPGRR